MTGGCGYIGSHVARAFKQQDPNNRVYIIDIVRRNHTLKDIDGYLCADYADDAALALYVGARPDVIVHCAGTSLVGPSILNPSEYWNNNVVKTARMLDAVKVLQKKPLILFSSSASVYGNSQSGAIPESAVPNPISPYGNTKSTIERMLSDYAVAYGLPSVCFRYFNAAGAEPINYDLGQVDGATHIVARALEASIAGKAFTLHGTDFETFDGTCVRDYVHVWDLAQAHVKAADAALPGNNVFNLGAGFGLSNLQIVKYIQEEYGLEIAYSPRRPGDPDSLIADTQRVRKVLNWVPRHSNLNDIIESAYKWYTAKFSVVDSTA